jgi:hypothetical protein
MPSAIENAITDYRVRLLRGDKNALDKTQAAYNRIRSTLIARLDELVKIATANSGLTGPEVLKLERVVSLLDDIETALDALSGPQSRFITSAQRQAVQLALETAEALVVAQGGARIGTAWNRANIEAVNSMVGRLSDGSPLSTYLDGLGSKASQAIREGLIDAIGTGMNPNALAAQLAKDLDVAGWKLAQTSRDAILGSYRSASLATYRANRDIGDSWTWLSALNGSCAACVHLHGETFPLDEEFMKTHSRCRCTPVFNVRGVDLGIEKGDDWFAKQPDKVQDKVLFKSGGAAYRSGELTLDDFTVLRRDPKWGDAYQQVSTVQARRQAQGGRRAA